MKKIEAETLENALIIASNTFECSVVDLEYEIIQNPSKGFLGIGKKLAIICAQPKSTAQKSTSNSAFKESKTTLDSINEPFSRNIKQDKKEESYLANPKSDSFHSPISSATYGSQELSRKPLRESLQEPLQESLKKDSMGWNAQTPSKIPNHRENLTKEQTNLSLIAKEVQQELKELLALMPYRLSEVFVEPYDENTLYIKIDGEDSALLIGKEGYRYKAISYLIFNWVNHVYGLMIRLEIAEFLHNQEEMIANYLLPVIESVKISGKAQTKPLDGVLAHIALKQLREKFPDKYVSFRMNSEGERYIIVNDFYHS
ncbi:Jag N-terminal domain-containing protein [Helicobacter sp. MIT 05-5294]|uniref:Jag N-terminal domain-containing protein n=1 Tax=Helicobacter sp. MIT 05-5294 TaxID=1548150 RepID=UPI00051FCF49|nr:Jag N-terminal domain-containing protein [Helicobacter sp. MIT 05-5294]TLD87509.1 protein jag [Helicobacter sp. MIT 05-5294]